MERTPPAARRAPVEKNDSPDSSPATKKENKLKLANYPEPKPKKQFFLFKPGFSGLSQFFLNQVKSHLGTCCKQIKLFFFSKIVETNGETPKTLHNIMQNSLQSSKLDTVRVIRNKSSLS
jgi:hypothetical protein